MTTSEFIEALQNDLREIGALGDESIAEASERLINALRSSAGLRLLDVLGEAAMEISSQLPSGHIELRMSGQEAEFVFVPEEEPVDAQPVPEDGTARITLRLSDSLKAGVEAAAATEGVSVNTWIVRRLSHSLSGSGTSQRSGKRITGFTQA
jgi:hypothetical protein